jgi:hypothetical protein
MILNGSLSDIIRLEAKNLFALLKAAYSVYEIVEGGPSTSSQNTIRINDLHLSSLRNIGKLNVSWTAFLDKHLLLAVGTRTLSLLWKDLGPHTPTMFRGSGACTSSLAPSFHLRRIPTHPVIPRISLHTNWSGASTCETTPLGRRVQPTPEM